MLKVSEYENLFEKLKELGYQFINEPHQYKHCHHSCEVLSLFSGYTPRYLYFPNISRELFDIVFTDEFLYEKLQEMRSDFTNEFFILKDAVKSEKHDKEIFKIPLSITNIELKSRIIKFIDTRGKLYNEGLAFKEFINLKQYQDNKINEWRIYVLEDEIVSCSQNTGLSKHKNIPQPNIADLLQHRNKIMSNFFTVDMAELENGSWTIIETGDAQVSGLSPQQNELKFYNKFYKTIKSLEFTP
jgi:hypothetical protein